MRNLLWNESESCVRAGEGERRERESEREKEKRKKQICNGEHTESLLK